MAWRSGLGASTGSMQRVLREVETTRNDMYCNDINAKTSSEALAAFYKYD